MNGDRQAAKLDYVGFSPPRTSSRSDEPGLTLEKYGNLVVLAGDGETLLGLRCLDASRTHFCGGDECLLGDTASAGNPPPPGHPAG